MSIEDLIAEALPEPPSEDGFASTRTPSYDPEDVTIPRDPDVFLGSGGGRRWRMF